MNKNQPLLKPGMNVPESGQYKIVGPRGGDLGGYEATFTEGERVPPSRISPNARFVQVDKTKHKSR